MIVLCRATKTFGGDAGPITILDEVSLEIPAKRRVALLGATGCGKTTFINVLAGLEPLSAGSIDRYANVSFPVGNVRLFRPTSTPELNTRFFARCYGLDRAQMWDFVQDLAELSDEASKREMRLLTPEQRVQFAYALAVAIPFDTYLFDGRLAVGGSRFKERFMFALEERLKSAGLIVATRDARFARQFCDAGLLIRDARMELYDELEESIGALANAPDT